MADGCWWCAGGCLSKQRIFNLRQVKFPDRQASGIGKFPMPKGLFSGLATCFGQVIEMVKVWRSKVSRIPECHFGSSQSRGTWTTPVGEYQCEGRMQGQKAATRRSWPIASRTGKEKEGRTVDHVADGFLVILAEVNHAGLCFPKLIAAGTVEKS